MIAYEDISISGYEMTNQGLRIYVFLVFDRPNTAHPRYMLRLALARKRMQYYHTCIYVKKIGVGLFVRETVPAKKDFLNEEFRNFQRTNPHTFYVIAAVEALRPAEIRSQMIPKFHIPTVDRINMSRFRPEAVWDGRTRMCFRAALGLPCADLFTLRQIRVRNVGDWGSI